MEENRKKLYTLLVYSENVAGILNQVTAVFTRRQVNIESLNVSASSIPGVHKYTITAWSDEDQIVKITRQIEKKVDVVKANYFTDEQLFIRESGLYKLSAPMVLENPEISRTIRRFQASIIEVNATYVIVQMHGVTEDIIFQAALPSPVACRSKSPSSSSSARITMHNGVVGMSLRRILFVCLFLVSLDGDAQIVVPDSLLNTSKSYLYNITSPDTAQAIITAVRKRQLEPAWRIDYAEGELNYNMRRYRKAVSFFGRVKAESSLRDSTLLQLLINKRLMDCYDALNLHDDLVRSIFCLRKMAREHGNKAFESMAVFMSGKQHHYHGQIDQGYSSCLEGLEIMKETEYAYKHIVLRNYYAELLKMYVRDGRFEEAVHMSQHQEAEALYPSSRADG